METEFYIALVMWFMAIDFGCLMDLIYNSGAIGITCSILMIMALTIFLLIYMLFEDKETPNETYY